jgi:hypothetical protein
MWWYCVDAKRIDFLDLCMVSRWGEDHGVRRLARHERSLSVFMSRMASANFIDVERARHMLRELVGCRTSVSEHEMVNTNMDSCDMLPHVANTIFHVCCG